jgi:hypothetical protein
MNNKLNNNPLRPAINFLSRYNLIIFIVSVVVGLSLAILALNNILQTPFDSANLPSSGNGQVSFDETTITRINTLKTSADAPTKPTLPDGRIDPFSDN